MSGEIFLKAAFVSSFVQFFSVVRKRFSIKNGHEILMFSPFFASNIKSQISRWNNWTERRLLIVPSECRSWLCLARCDMIEWTAKCVYFCSCSRCFMCGLSFTFIRVNERGSSKTTNRDSFLSPISHFFAAFMFYWLDCAVLQLGRWNSRNGVIMVGSFLALNDAQLFPHFRE